MINVDDLFDYVSYTIDHEPHIVLDPGICSTCDHRGCTTTCPARCYTWSEEDRKIGFVYDGCLECGTCYIVCDKQAFSRWRYPRGGFGASLANSR